jgi:hypothetical protein
MARDGELTSRIIDRKEYVLDEAKGKLVALLMMLMCVY